VLKVDLAASPFSISVFAERGNGAMASPSTIAASSGSRPTRRTNSWD
jgi:hypothetical protein